MVAGDDALRQHRISAWCSVSLYRRAAKRDANEAAIFAALRAAGVAVLPMSMRGAPDAIAFASGGRVWLLEVKAAKGRLTKDQITWRATWKGPAPVTVRSVDEALALLRLGVGGDD